ncbi:PDZ and LIM domain protein 2-like [Cydia amplana]|uniref:PDZ and LIM domain protein 2-like n=1 Tax=Cydia amplana TaxID=1869771 RepID=UPI002FE5B0EA
MPSENMAIDMRHSKLKASEAAMLAGEIQKPSWQSRNEGIHERVSFEDAIWGFDLAGGSFYKTPLRVVAVKPDSRAEKAGIRPGDKLLRINDIDTSTLSIQEAHAIIIESGIHLKIAVTSPDDEEDAYYCYEDSLDNGYDSEEERRKEEEKARKRQVHAKVSSYWSLQWPWVSKRRIIYRESNCFMVPSKYEGKHRDKFPVQPMIRTQKDIVLDSIQSTTQQIMDNPKDKLQNYIPKESQNTNSQGPIINGQTKNIPNGTASNVKENKITLPPKIPEVDEDSIQEVSEVEELNEVSIQEEVTNSAMEEESIQEEVLEEEEVSELDSEVEEKSQIDTSEATDNHDNVLNEVLENHDISADEEDKILNSILSNGDTSESMDER